MKIAIELKNIKFNRHEQNIIDDINLTIKEGEFVTLVGPNGSGKSTLLKIINGIIAPDSGNLYINGQNLTRKTLLELSNLVRMLTQDLNNSTFSDLTILENLSIAGISNNSKKNIEQYLAKFNPALSEKLNLPSSRLSGGQRQALALAMCFTKIPYLLLLDEHTSAFDPKSAMALMSLTNNHINEKKITTIMITHNLDYALQFGTRLIAINQGKITADLIGDNKYSITKSELIKMVY